MCILNTQILLLAQRHANPNACGELFLLLSTRPYASAVIALRTTLPAANISQLGRRTKKARAASASIYLIRNHAEKMSVVIHSELEEKKFVLILFFVVAVSPTFELNCQQKASNQTK